MRRIILKNGMELTVREADADEAELICEFRDKNKMESEYFTFEDGDCFYSFNGGLDYIRSYNRKENSTVIIALINNELSGVLCFYGGTFDSNRHVGEFNMSVSQKYWDLGIGSALLYHMMEWAKDNGITKKINLKVREDDVSSITLYKKCGFIKEGVLSRNTYVEGCYFDTVQMGLVID